MLGRNEEILIAWEKDDQFFGRTRNFKEVYFDKSNDFKIWDIANIHITELNKYVLNWKYA
jgi:tRNA A37 methylthiotransferase MiaB